MTRLIVFTAEYLYILAPLAAVLLFFRLDRKRRRSFVIFAAIALPLAYVLARLAGMLYDNPPPFVVQGIPPLMPQDPENGFPSDHTLLTAAIAAVVLFFNRQLGVILGLVAVLVGIARVMALVHHPVDIAASLILAYASAWLVWKFYLAKRA